MPTANSAQMKTSASTTNSSHSTRYRVVLLLRHTASPAHPALSSKTRLEGYVALDSQALRTRRSLLPVG